MKVQRDALVELEFELKNPEGELLEEARGDDSIAYVHGYGLILPGIETALEGHSAGEVLELVLAAHDAFGEYDPEKITSVPRDEFPPELELAPGEWITAQVEGEEGEEDELDLRVVEVDDEAVVLDANPHHAGTEVHAWVRISAVREASREERLEAETAAALLD